MKPEFCQITCFKEKKNMAVEKDLRVTINIYKKTSSSFHMEQETFIEVSCINNIPNGENIF